MSPARRNLLRLLIVTACVAALVWAVVSLGPRRVLDTVLAADPAWLALSVVAVVGRFVIWGFKWTRMLRRREAVPFGLATRILIAGTFVNQTTPTAKLAGGFVRAGLLHRRRGWDLPGAYGWAMADQVTNLLGHFLLYGALAIALALTALTPQYRPVLWLSGGPAIAAVLFFVVFRDRIWTRLEHSGLAGRLTRLVPARFRKESTEARADAVAAQVLRPLFHEGRNLRDFLPDVLLASCAFGSLCLGNVIVLRALGVDAPILAVVVAVVLGYVAGVAVGWGGVGVTEAALAALFVQLGIATQDAAAAALLHRAIYYAVVLLWGGFALVKEGR